MNSKKLSEFIDEPAIRILKDAERRGIAIATENKLTNVDATTVFFLGIAEILAEKLPK